MKIQYYIRQAFGRKDNYIVDKKMADLLAILTGRRVVSNEQMEALKELGFTFERVPEPIQ